MKKGLNIIILGSLLLALGGCTSYSINGKNIDKDANNNLSYEKSLTQAKISYGEPEQIINCKNGGNLLRYQADSQMGADRPKKLAIFLYYDTAGNYVSQGDQAKAACL